MRVEDRSRLTKTGSAQRSSSAGGADARFSLPEKQAASSASAAAGVQNLDALIALQSVDEREARRERQRRGAQRGTQILDKLDQLKMGLLEGRLSTDDLTQLSHLLKDAREQVDDPQLDDLLAHIDLRAQVEMAKLTMGDRPQPALLPDVIG